MRYRLDYIAVGLAAVLMLASCGDEDSEETTAAAQDGCTGDTLCFAECTVNGIQGRVVVPSCSDAAFFADVTLLDELGAEIATTEADAQGEFMFTPPSDGSYIIRATRGPFKTGSPKTFEVSSGVSPFQVVVVE